MLSRNFRNFLIATLAAASTVTSGATPAHASEVHVLAWEDAVTPVTRSAIQEALATAVEADAAALVITLDTPGGLLDATRDIVTDLLESEVPVIVWVAPAGGRAASAGVFITMAAHVAAMAPGTNIGAASPVSMGGGAIDSTMAHKLFNDTAAFARTIAEQRGRNVEWAEEAVREAVSVTETEAVDANIVDFVAESIEDVLAQAHGLEIETPSGPRTLDLEGAEIIHRELSLRFRLLSLLANPNIAYILMMLGVYGLFFELQNPGAVFPGVVGALCLILALYSMQTVPMNVAGILLIVLGAVLFILEVKIQSFGLLTIGGIVASAIGALMVVDSPVPALRASLGVVIPVTVATVLMFVIAVGLAIRTMRTQPTTGQEGMIGLAGVVRTARDAESTIEVHGELWKAISDESLADGDRVEVVTMQGLLLKVKKS